MSSSAEMHVLYRVANAPVHLFPFPHIYVSDVFPADHYRQLRKHLPPSQSYRSLKSLQRVVGDYPETRLVIPLEPDHIGKLSEPYRAFWTQTAQWMLGGEFAALVLSKFAGFLDQRFGDARSQHFANEALLVQDYSTYRLPPHTDTPSKVLSFLFYLPEDRSLEHLGTSIYLPKDRRQVSEGLGYHDPADFERLVTMPYVPNALFAFVKTPNAFHGVEPIDAHEVKRDLLLYDIKVKKPADPKPAAAKPGAAKIDFSF